MPRVSDLILLRSCDLRPATPPSSRAHRWFEMIAVVPSNFVMLMVNGSL